MAPHLYAGPVEWAANVHLAVSCPNILMVEAIETPFHEALVTGRPKVENGFVAAPSAPGLGIELNEDVAAAHPSPRTGCTWRCRRRPATGRTGTISPVVPPTEDRIQSDCAASLHSFSRFFAYLGKDEGDQRSCSWA
jgi:hypothetical protein